MDKCRVTRDYQASNLDPFAVEAGETFTVTEKVDVWSGNPQWLWMWCVDQRGKGGWLPKDHIERLV